MRDRLPSKIRKNETGIVNLDGYSGEGTHWVCYKKLQDKVYYFDSLGNIPPPLELLQYFKSAKYVMHNHFTTFNSIPNISENENNKFHYYKQNPIEKEASTAVTETEIVTESTSTAKEIKPRKERAPPPVLETVILQTGSYEIEHINKELQKSL